MADIYDALSADRPYHAAMPQEKVLRILREGSATKIDPQCVAILEDLATENKVQGKTGRPTVRTPTRPNNAAGRWRRPGGAPPRARTHPRTPVTSTRVRAKSAQRKSPGREPRAPYRALRSY